MARGQTASHFPISGIWLRLLQLSQAEFCPTPLVRKTLLHPARPCEGIQYEHWRKGRHAPGDLLTGTQTGTPTPWADESLRKERDSSRKEVGMTELGSRLVPSAFDNNQLSPVSKIVIAGTYYSTLSDLSYRNRVCRGVLPSHGCRRVRLHDFGRGYALSGLTCVNCEPPIHLNPCSAFNPCLVTDFSHMEVSRY